MEHRQLSFKKSQVSYYRFGSGKDIALCFHGYGEEGTFYHFFEKYAGQNFTFYSIDLPYHGKTEWNDGLSFTHNDLQEIVSEILDHHNFNSPIANSKYTLLGFSLGGRIALSLYQAHPETIDKIVLLAPDGLKVNFWYWLATQTILGNKLFAFSMKKPGWFWVF